MHRSDADLLNLMYGIGERDSHLDECVECSARLKAMRKVRLTLAAEPRVSPDFLAAQRRAIWNRIEKPSWRPRLFSPYPAAVAVLAAVLAILVTVPRPGVRPAMASSDEQLFSDVAAQVARPWPGDVEPVSGPPAAHTAGAAVVDSSTPDARLFEEIANDVAGNEPRAAAPIRVLYSEGD